MSESTGSAVQTLMGAGMLLCLCASVGLWLSAIIGRFRGQAIVPPEPRPRYPGGLAEVLIAAGIYIVVSGVLTGIFLGQPRVPELSPATEPSGLPKPSADVAAPDAPDLSRLVPLIVINSVGTLAGILATIGWMRMQGFSWSEMGLRPHTRHLGLGVRGVVMILPPAMILQGVLVMLVDDYSHPVLEILQQPQPLIVIAAMAISSTLVAPLTEEFFFRGLMQGWLEKVAGVGTGTAVHLGEFAASGGAPVSGAALDTDPYAPPALVAGVSQTLDPSAPTEARRPYWPMIVSSFAFAIVHFGQGPAPFTLFFFALGIGYLYRQTGSIWPGIIVHMGLNGLTTAVTIATMMQ